MWGSKKSEGGFTLVEMVVVVLLMVFLSSLAINRSGALDSWRSKSEIRRFVNVWEFVYADAQRKQEGYRLIIDFENNSYHVLREIPVETAIARDVDYLANLRLDSEKQRRAEKQESNLPKIEEEFKAEDARESQELESIFYKSYFRDPLENIRLGIPISQPSLGENHKLGSGIKFRDVYVAGEKFDSAHATIRFSPKGASDFAVVHFDAGSTIYTANINPATGQVKLQEGDINFEWQLRKKQD